MKYTVLLIFLLISLKLMSQDPDLKDRNKKIPPEFIMYSLSKGNITASIYESKAHGGFNDFFPYLVIDGNITNNSSWRAENDGQWIQIDLTENVPVDHIQVAFMRGELRSYRYTIEISKDGAKKWKMIIPITESQKVQGFQKITFPPKVNCRYIRITGYGNSDPEFKNWFNINELQIFYRTSKK